MTEHTKYPVTVYRDGVHGVFTCETLADFLEQRRFVETMLAIVWPDSDGSASGPDQHRDFYILDKEQFVRFLDFRKNLRDQKLGPKTGE